MKRNETLRREDGAATQKEVGEEEDEVEEKKEKREVGMVDCI